MKLMDKEQLLDNKLLICIDLEILKLRENFKHLDKELNNMQIV